MTNPYPEKLYHNLLVGVVEVLHQIFNEQQQAERVVEHALKTHAKWGANDRRFVAQIVYDMVRNWRLIHTIVQFDELPSLTYADLWTMVGVWLSIQKVLLPPWEEWRDVPSQADIWSSYQQLAAQREYAYSLPEWLDSYGVAQLGADKWEAEVAAMHQPTHVHIRVNTLQTTKAKLMADLAREGIEALPVAWSKYALQLEGRKNLMSLKSYKKGDFEIQDAASQLIAPYLSPQPNMTVIDACAGAGGKTLHLAALMQNKGHLVAMDTVEWKLEKLQQRADRNGATIIRTQAIVSPQNIIRQHHTADRLLLDVPCSGSGTLRRKPDLKWRMTAESLPLLQQTQQHILQNYTPMLKKGGLFVYATCSIFPVENEQQIRTFLAENPNYNLLKEQHIFPSQYPTDGFYMACLQRNS
ncbi:MAG: methyltransferase domain-containing protein [Chitinophagales bacterium]|nr:methyltransferase domain-containing protein [Chitinophagales bacterium]